MNKRSNTLASRLEVATNEDKQVNPIYVSAIAKGLTKIHINRGGAAK